MRELQRVLGQGHHILFQSPTGTGKTLTILVAIRAGLQRGRRELALTRTLEQCANVGREAINPDSEKILKSPTTTAYVQPTAQNDLLLIGVHDSGSLGRIVK